MSLYKNYYIIAGYDLSAYKTEKYEDWKWTDEGEQYICRQSKGNIQLFDDPCNGDHLYLGYILANGDQYEFRSTNIETDIIDYQRIFVNNALFKLIGLGVIDDCYKNIDYKVIVFEEVT